MAVSGSVHSAISTSPGLRPVSALRARKRRQGTFEPAQIDGLLGHVISSPGRAMPAAFAGLAQYNSDAERWSRSPTAPQRIARLTPLADVLARIDALVEPVAPRADRPLRRARPHPGRGCRHPGADARRWRARCATAGRCDPSSPPTPAPMRRRRCRPPCGSMSGSRFRPMPMRSRRSMRWRSATAWRRRWLPVGPGEGVLPARRRCRARSNAAAGGPAPRRRAGRAACGGGHRPRCACARRACVSCAPGRPAMP